MTARSCARSRRRSMLSALLALLATATWMSPLDVQASGPRIVDEGDRPAADVDDSHDDDGGHPTHVTASPETAPPGDLEPSSDIELILRGGLLYNGNRDHLADEVLYGGAELATRWRFASWCALVAGLGLHTRNATNVALSETRIAMDLGVDVYVVSGEVFELYTTFGAAVGGGSVSRQLGASLETSEYTEVGGHVGLGSDVRFGDLFINSQLRIPMLGRVGAEPAPDRDYVRTAEVFRVLLAWSVGAGYRF